MNSPGETEGDAWRERLPEALERCQRLWSLALGGKLEGGSLAEVRGCRGPRGEDLVLKLSPPMAAPAAEAKALRHWGGRGAAKLVAFDADTGALLLERVRPGGFLMERDRTAPDDELAIRAASGVLAAIQAAPLPREGAFLPFGDRLSWWMDWAEIKSEPGAAGTPLLPVFERSARSLDASARGKRLLHGDFVAKNLLLDGDGDYVAIDPLPCIGDPCSDIGQFSAYHSPAATVVVRARAIATATGNDPDRAAQWAALWTVFQASETWREDAQELQAWASGNECLALLASAEG